MATTTAAAAAITVATATAATTSSSAAAAAIATATAASTTTTTSAATAAIAAATAAAAATLGFGTSFVHHDAATADFGFVQLFNRFLGLGRIGHLHKGEPPRSAGLPVNNDIHLADLAECLERLANILVGCRERKVAHINVSHFKIP